MIPAEKAHLNIAAVSDPGMKGKNNEDQFAVAAYTRSPEDPAPVVFAIVADGIGGHRAGEVASSIAVEMICDAVGSSDASQPVLIMESALIQASQAIYAQGNQRFSIWDGHDCGMRLDNWRSFVFNPCGEFSPVLAARTAVNSDERGPYLGEGGS